MKVFISWSGEKGKAVAEIVSAWLPSVIQAVRPFFSPDDIAKGARWSSEVGSELEACQVGIVIVTKESLSAPWILFEAGALSKNVGRSKVVPLLVDLEPAEARGPLMQFQCATFEEVEIKRVLRMINSELRDLSLTEGILESVFSVWWPRLESQVAQVLQRADAGVPAPQKKEREILEEILSLTQAIAENLKPKKELTKEKEEPPKEGPAEVGESPLELSGALTLKAVQKRMREGGNLAGANLMNLNLARLDLSGANLRGANLVLANLSRSRLVGADLDGANLEGAILDRADLQGARLSRTNLWRASMIGVQNLASVASMDKANCFEVEIDEDNRKILAGHETLSLSTYPDLFAHYLEAGMTRADLRDLFLWAAHSYPDEPL